MSEMEDKLNSLTPEELNALNTDPELLNAFKTKYGTHGHETLQQLAPQSMASKPLMQAVGEKTQEGFNQAGQNLAENLAGGVSLNNNAIRQALPPPFGLTGAVSATPGQGTQVNPNVAAAAGTAVQMAPDIATSFVPGAEAKPAIEAGASKLGSAVGDIAQTLKAPGEASSRVMADNMLTQQAPQAVVKAKQYIQPMIEKAQDTMTSLRQALQNIPQEMAQKKGMLDGLNQAAKKGMQAVEEATPGLEFKGGKGFEDYVKNSSKMSELAEIMAKWKNKVPDSMPLEQQQLFRKLAQEGSDNVNNISRAVLQQGRESLAQNIAKQVPEWGAQRSRYLEVQDALRDLPKDKLAKTTALKNGLLSAQNELKDMQAQAKQLMDSAKNADAEELLSIKQKANDLIQRGIKHDKYVKGIIGTIGAAGATAFGLKKMGGQ